jgi:hypothetical protein
MAAAVAPSQKARAEEDCRFGRHPLGYCLDTPTLKGRIRKAPQRLLLESLPPGTRVYVDGQLLSEGGIPLLTPQQLVGRHLPSGVSVFDFEMPGFMKYSRRLAVQRHGVNRICALLEPLAKVKLRANVDCLLKKEMLKEEPETSTEGVPASEESPAPFMELQGGKTKELSLEPGRYRFICSAKDHADSVVNLSVPSRWTAEAQSDCETLDAELHSRAEQPGLPSEVELPLQQFNLAPVPVEVDIESDIANLAVAFLKVENTEAACPLPSPTDARITLRKASNRLRLADGVGWYCVSIEYQYKAGQTHLFNKEQQEILRAELWRTSPSGLRAVEGNVSSVLSRRIFVPTDGYVVSMKWREAATNHNQLVETNIVEPRIEEFKEQIRSCWEPRPKECRLGTCWEKTGKGCEIPSCWKVDTSTCHKAAAVIMLSRTKRDRAPQGPDYREIAGKLVWENIDRIKNVRGGLRGADIDVLRPLGVEAVLFAASCRRGIAVACETLGARFLEAKQPKQALPFLQLACLQGSESACLRAIDPTGWPKSAELFELIPPEELPKSRQKYWWKEERSLREWIWDLEIKLAGIPWSTSGHPWLATVGMLGAVDYKNGRWYAISARFLSPLVIGYGGSGKERFAIGVEVVHADLRYHPRGGIVFMNVGGAVELRGYDTIGWSHAGASWPALLFNGWHAGLGLLLRGWTVGLGVRAESIRTANCADSNMVCDWHLLPFVTLQTRQLWEN